MTENPQVKAGRLLYEALRRINQAKRDRMSPGEQKLVDEAMDAGAAAELDKPEVVEAAPAPTDPPVPVVEDPPVGGPPAGDDAGAAAENTQP